MARSLKFKQEAKEFEFAYQSLLFPKREMNGRAEERSLGVLLDAFEAAGEQKKVNTGTMEFTSYVASGKDVEIKEESQFVLLKELVEASRPNGIWMRAKLSLVEQLEKSPELEVKVVKARKASDSAS